MSLRHRPALDGVRAFAVVAVLLFHALPQWLPGGFLGVDAFFVLSGYLITALLLAEHERTGRIRLAGFWARRARRLLPALVLLVAVVVLTFRWVLDEAEFPAVRVDAVAALFYVANWRMLYRGGGYFAETGTASPLQHTWSLGIEEQFYLFWPLVVVVAGHARRPRVAIGALAGTGAIGSLALAAWLYHPDRVDRVYYGTDTRASALLVGCALAAALPALRRVPAWLGWPALGAVAVAWATADGTVAWLYRGGLCALSIATAVVIGHLVTAPAGALGRLFALAPLAWLGRISYGVYLWHWPLYALLDGDRTRLSGPTLFGVRAAATIAVATASFYLVEQPIRRRRPVPWRLVVPVAASVLVFAATVSLLPPRAGTRWASAAGPGGLPAGGSAASPPASPSARPDRRPGGPRVMISGDSVAWTLGQYLPSDPRIWLVNRGFQGCGIARLPDILYAGSPHTNYPGCTTWDARWRTDVATYDPDVVAILLDRWELMDRRLDGRYQHVGEPEYDAYLTGELNLAISIAGSRGARVVLFTPPYTHRAERPDGSLWPEDTPERTDAWNRLIHTVALTSPLHPVILDLQAVVCPDHRFTWTVGSVRVRSDGLHFTPEGVRQVIAPWLLPQLDALAAE